MNEDRRFTIAAILLSIGMVQVPCDARTGIAMKTSGIGKVINYQAQQHERPLSKRLLSQSPSSAYQWITLNKGKSPALLWHRFSLIAQPVFFHWLMAI